MSLHSVSLAFRSPSVESVAFLLDGSLDGTEREASVALLEEILARLHADAKRAIFFLGNPRAYPAEDFSEHADAWWAENERRGRVITAQLMAALRAGGFSFVVLLCSGKVYNLRDWLDEDLLARLRIVSAGDREANLEPGVEVCQHDSRAVVGALQDPPQVARISGPGFMPLWWNNRSYEVVVEEGRASLIAKAPRDYAIEFFGLAERGAAVNYSVTRDSGKDVEGHLEGGEFGTPLETPTQTALSDKEALAFRQALDGPQFTCPCCNEKHPSAQLTCDFRDDGRGLSAPVYEVLSRKQGLMLFRPDDNGCVFCEQYPSQGLELAGNRVVIEQRQKVSLFEWATEKRLWQSLEQNRGPFQPLGDGRHVVTYG